MLADCLASLEAAAPGWRLEIVVVDNASTDGSQQAPPPPGSEYRLLQNEENLGFARANNQGLAVCRGNIVLLLNPDTICFPGALGCMADYLMATSETGALCPRTWLDLDRTVEVCSLKIPTPFRSIFTHTPLGLSKIGRRAIRAIWMLDASLFCAESGAVPVEGIGGACFMVRRDVLDRIGPLDEGYFMGYEDTDWSLKVSRLGYRIEILTDAEIVHLFGQSKRKRPASDQVWYRWDRGLLRFLSRHYPGWQVTCFAGVMRGSDALLACRRRISPRGSVQQTAVETAEGITIDFSDNGPFVFEVSNTPLFFDKFGRKLNDSTIHLARSLLQRWAPGRYYWRIARPDHTRGEVYLKSGQFTVPHCPSAVSGL